MNKKLVVLSVSPFLWTMGQGIGIPSLYQTLKGFVAAGHEFHLILPQGKDEAKYELYEDVHVHRFKGMLKISLPVRILGLILQKASWISFIFFASIKAYKVAKKIEPDVIYGFTSHGAPVAYIISRIYGIPNITRLFGVQSLYPFLSRPIRLLSCFDQVLPFKLTSSALIITNDGTQGNKVAEKLKVPPSRLKFWMNGVDKGMFGLSYSKEELGKLRQSLQIKGNSKVILSVSRLVAVKRVDRIIKAVLATVSKNKDVVFVIVGDGSQRQSLENLARGLGVAEYVRFTGAVPREKVPLFMNLGDIFVSLYDESNLGNPLLEALVSGKCIVTLNTGATGQVIVNNQNGILLGIDELGRLPEVINALLDDDDLRKSLEENARKYVLEHLQTWEERIKKEVELVETICSREGRIKDD